MSVPRIAVLGSCVTRDVWWDPDFQATQPELFIGRTSLASASLAEGRANLLEPLRSLLPSTGRFGKEMVMIDLGKTGFAQIAANRPDALFFDFIDERFDLLDCGGALATESLELLESGLMMHAPLAQARRIPRLSAEAWSVWLDGLLRLRRFVDEGNLPSCRLILHACLWADAIRTEAGLQPFPDACEILHGRVTSRAAHNDLLRRMHDAFAACFPEAVVIEMPARLRIADEAHRWGPAPFHFIPDYYRAFAEAAAAAGVPLGPACGKEAACSGA